MGLVEAELLDYWYKEDTNCVPSVFILQPISSILFNFNNKKEPELQAKDQCIWWETLDRLQKLLRIAANDAFAKEKINAEQRHNFMMSVTEREIINGILNVENTKSHCLAYIRHIQKMDMTKLGLVGKFIDLTNGGDIDKEAQNLLSNLRDERIIAKIQQPNLIKFKVEWSDNDGLNDSSHSEYLQQFSNHFYHYITKLVRRAMRKEDQSPFGKIITEILHHCNSCNAAVEVFLGRDDELNKIYNYIIGDAQYPIVLYGFSGSGKTSLLAKAASLVSQWCSKPISKPILILRFIGTTPESTSVIPMLTSICQQISYNFMLPLENLPDDLIALIFYFKQLLFHATEQHPLFVFIDSLDQLSGPSEAGIKLSWLTQELPPNVKMIVSCASDGDTKDFDILRRIIDNDMQYIEIKPLSTDLAIDVIKKWLNVYKRDLSLQQWTVVQNAISECTLPIFIKLVFAEIVRWKSYSKSTETCLSNTVMDTIMKLFDRIEVQHGKTLVSHALSYITASKNGLSEGELEDLISLDDIVLDDVYQYHMPPARRIPPLLWTRIRNDLPNYLTERDADGVSALNWCHKQFREASLRRYFQNDNLVIYFHSSIADYFLGIWGGGKCKPFKYTDIQKQRFHLKNDEGAADRMVPIQPLAYQGVDGRIVRFNLRKLGELPFHLIRSKRYHDLLRIVLFDYDWLHSKLSCCPLQSVISDFEDAIEKMEKNRSIDRNLIHEISLLCDALRLAGAVLILFPNMLSPQILARLLPLRHQYSHINSLLNQCDGKGAYHCALLPVNHCLHTPGGPLMYSLEGHQFAVFDFVITSDFRYVLSVSNRFIMWDLSTGEISRDVDPQVKGIMQTLVLTSDDKFAITYTNYNEIYILNILTGEVRSIGPKQTEFDENIIGLSLATNGIHAIAWTCKEWLIMDVKQKYIIIDSLSLFSLTQWKDFDDNSQIQIITIDYVNFNELHMIIQIEEGIYHLETIAMGLRYDPIIFYGGFVLNSQKTLLFIGDKSGKISYMQRGIDKWTSLKLVSYSEPKRGDELLSLSLKSNETLLIAVYLRGFHIWKLCDGHPKIDDELYLQLPAGVRNITIKPLKSQISLVFTKYNQYAIAGVRKNLYVWSLQSGDLLKTLDAHYGRILQMKELIVDELNAVISSSFDKSIKVWNVKNLFEHVHTIDRMELPIDSISFSSVKNIAIAVTRNCIGIWSLESAKLWTTLADSPIGAIVTHAIITDDGKYIVSTESGNFLVWDVEKGNVIFKCEQNNVKHLILTDNHTKAIIVEGINSDDNNGNNMLLIVRSIPDGNVSFTIPYFTIDLSKDKMPIVTIDNHYIVILTKKLSNDHLFLETLAIYSLIDGLLLHTIELDHIKFTELIACPYRGKGCVVSLISADISYLIDVYTQRVLSKITRWGGKYTSDGKFGLFAPNRGGLELVELRYGSTVKVLLPRTSEGVFNIIAEFTSTDEYVYYYHSGRKTIRLIRLEDGKVISNYRVSAEAKVIKCTPDGAFLVVGGIDGSFIVLVIADPHNEEYTKRLNDLQSRISSGPISTRNPYASWKFAAKLATMVARTKNEDQTVDSNTSNTCVIS